MINRHIYRIQTNNMKKYIINKWKINSKSIRRNIEIKNNEKQFKQLKHNFKTIKNN